MDDKDKFITVSHNNAESDDAAPKAPDSQQQFTDNDIEIDIPQEQDTPPVSKYDDFMYQPIGFGDSETDSSHEDKTASDKKHKFSNNKIIILLLALIFIVTLLLAVYGIISDIAGSRSSFSSYTASGSGVVVYQSQKPVTASNSDYVDDDGKYTTEGIAATVRPSIVEIYTYSDMHHQNLLGTGSGIVISKDGYIVTNAHVLQSDGYHTIITSDDEVYDAKIIGRDSKTDIAIIKVSGVELSPATLGDSDEVVVGEQVMAIGNPAGLSGSVTDGIVSAVNRKIRSDSTGFEMNCIQTNADISPGNSGGALVNMYGQVIGITSSKYVSSSYEGLGFAITINDALPIIEELINQGYISGRFRIGIQLIDMSSEYNIAAIQNDLGYELPEDFLGVYISEISDDCDISNTKLKVSDFITAINGKTISTYDELYDTISSMYGAGDTVPATCANVDKDGNITYYEIEFKLMEDTSGDF
jgi:serine protease Do